MSNGQQAREALPPPELTSNAVNDACWALVEALPEPLSGANFNFLKPAFFAALMVVHQKHYAAIADAKGEQQ